MKTVTTTIVLIEELDDEESYDKDYLQNLVNEYGLDLFSGTVRRIIVTNVKITDG